MAAKKPAFVDLSNDDDDAKEKKRKKPRTSLVHDRPQNLTCWVCKEGVMVHKPLFQVVGTYQCLVCHGHIKTDKLTYCTNDKCGYIWCRGCWRIRNHKIQKEMKKTRANDTKSSE